MFVFWMVVTIYSCNQDPCDVRHTLVDGECIPDYIFPQNSNPKSGEKYYHLKHGVIIYKEGVWLNSENYVLIDLENK